MKTMYIVVYSEDGIQPEKNTCPAAFYGGHAFF